MRRLLLSVTGGSDAALPLRPSFLRLLRSRGAEAVLVCGAGRAAADPGLRAALAGAAGEVEEVATVRRAPRSRRARALEVLERAAGRAALALDAVKWPRLRVVRRVRERLRPDLWVHEIRERRLAAETAPEIEALLDRLDPDLVLTTRPHAPDEGPLLAAARRRRLEVLALLAPDARPGPAGRRPGVQVDRLIAFDRAEAREALVRHRHPPGAGVVLDAAEPERALAAVILGRWGIDLDDRDLAAPRAARAAHARPRVLMVGPETLPIPPRGGAVQRYIHEVSRRLAADLAITTCSPPPDGPGPAATGPDAFGIERRHLDAGAYAPALRRLLETERFDIIHVFNRTPHLRAVLEGPLRGARVVVSLHNLVEGLNADASSEAARLIGRADAIVGNGPFVADRALRRAPGARGRVVSIPSGVDLAAFRPRWERRSEVPALRAKYGLGAADGPVLVYVGVLKRRKGVHLLPDVLDRVRRRFAGAALLVVGSGWHGGDRPPDDFGREVERAAGRVGPAIRFTGFAPPEAVPDILAAADIVIAPAQWEDVFPRVNIEALAVGVPLVTSPRGGIPEAAVDGRTALLVRAYASAEGHAEAVCRLLDDPALAERLARNGRRLVERRYTWERTANDFRMLYAALLAGRSGTTDARCGRWTAAPARSS